MKLVTFEDKAGSGLGVLDDGAVVDLRGVAGVPAGMIELIEAGAPAMDAVRAAVTGGGKRLSLDGVRLSAPIPVPRRNIFCVGKNYHDHVGEMHRSGFDPKTSEAPQFPVIFTKSPGCVIGPDAEIPGHLDPTASVDYEAEIAVIIGKPGRGIKAGDAWKHIFGYTMFNDVTARILQRQHLQWFIGKSIDGFGPMGPCIVTSDEIGDVAELDFSLTVNGEQRQHGVASGMIFDIPSVIETLSRTMRLEAGDVIATGTPSGVGMGFTPPRFLKKGDVVEIVSPRIGTLRNTVG